MNNIIDIFKENPAVKYDVIIDETNNSDEDIDNGIMNIDISFHPKITKLDFIITKEGEIK